MANNAFFITERYLKNNSPLSDNIDVKELYPHAKTAEDIYIQEAIGTSLYDRLIESLQASPQNTTDDEVELLKKIRDALVWYTAYEALPWVWVKIRNVGLVKQSGENMETTSQAEMNHLRKELKNKGDYYLKKVQDYLCKNAELFPDFTCTCSSCCASGNAIKKGNTSAMAFEQEDFCPPTTSSTSSSTTSPYAKSVNGVNPDSAGNITLDCSNFDCIAERASGLVSGGDITIDGTDVTVAAAEWYIQGLGLFEKTTASEFTVALSSAGKQRYVCFFGDEDGVITKVEGTEDDIASFPAAPADSALIGYVLVGDSSVGEGVDLSGYLLISSKATGADVMAGTNDDKYLTPLAASVLATNDYVDNGDANSYANALSDANDYTDSVLPYDISSLRYSGKRYTSRYGSETNINANGITGSAIFIPYCTGKAHSVDELFVYVSANPTVNYTIRMALYAADSSGYPTSPLAESGSIQLSSTGRISYSFAAVPLTDKLYFLAYQISGSGGTVPQLLGTVNPMQLLYFDTNAGGTGMCTVLKSTQAYGAFPSPLSAGAETRLGINGWNILMGVKVV